MKNLHLKFVLMILTCFCGICGFAQLRVTDYASAENAKAVRVPFVSRDTLRIQDHELIDRGVYAEKYIGKTIEISGKSFFSLTGWQPMAVGEIQKINDKRDTSANPVSTPYHLLPLLKEGGNVPRTINSRWGKSDKKGAER